MVYRIFLFTAAITSFFVLSASAGAADSRGIEAVRAKKVLENGDLKVIDEFVGQAVEEILTTEDFSSISNVRSLIVANSASSEAGQAQFESQFSESALKHIGAALQQAEAITQPQRKVKVIINLLILIDDLADPRLIDLPLKYVDDKNSVISYWAVRCLTNPKVVEKIQLENARKIAGRLETAASSGNYEMLRLIASFAASVKIPEGDALLLKAADIRIASYADWSVRGELIDADILKLLADKMAAANPGKAEAGRRFGQLMSYVFQRYIKGDNTLKPSQKEQLVSVLVETERTCLAKLTGKPSFGIKKALESGDLTALREEHNTLLGDANKQGVLPAQIGFDYGNGATQPLQLSPPAATP
jgi:hypothetical protein